MFAGQYFVLCHVVFRNRKINGSSSEASPRIWQWRSFLVPCRYRDSEIMELKNCLPWTSSALPMKIHLIKVFTVLILVWLASSFSNHTIFVFFHYVQIEHEILSQKCSVTDCFPWSLDTEPKKCCRWNLKS